MGFVMGVSFCEICGKQISNGQRYCEKHKESDAYDEYGDKKEEDNGDKKEDED